MSNVFDFKFGEGLGAAIRGEADPNELARKDFAAFMERVVRDASTGELVKVQDFQREVIAALEKQARVALIVLPRGFTKSTIVEAYCSWIIGNNPNIRIIVASHTEDQAISRLTGIEAILRSPEYQEIFGNLVPEGKRAKWSETVKTVLRDRLSMTAPTLRAVGAGGAKAIGQRCDLLVVDDIIGPTAAESPAERQAVWDWMMGPLKYVQNSVRDPHMVVTNTRYHEDDAAGRLRIHHKNDDETQFIDIDLPALRGEPGQEESIWPDMHPTADLLAQRERDYLGFQTHMMNDPINVRDAKLQEHWLNYTDHPDVLVGDEEHMTYHFGIDPNTAQGDIKSDYFAIVVVGVNKRTNRNYVVDMLYTKENYEEIRDRFYTLAAKYTPESIYLESNGAQSLFPVLFGDGDPYKFPFILVPSTIKKEERILQMSNHFMSGKISVLGFIGPDGRHRPIPVLADLRKEWLTFPQSKDSHFDALDALTFAIHPIVDYLTNHTVASITPAEFIQRIQLEQALRAARILDPKRAEIIEEKIREIDRTSVVKVSNADGEVELSEGICKGCNEHKQLHVDTKGSLCYDCYLDVLEDQYRNNIQPRTYMGHAGSWNPQERLIGGNPWAVGGKVKL